MFCLPSKSRCIIFGPISISLISVSIRCLILWSKNGTFFERRLLNCFILSHCILLCSASVQEYTAHVIDLDFWPIFYFHIKINPSVEVDLSGNSGAKFFLLELVYSKYILFLFLYHVARFSGDTSLKRHISLRCMKRLNRLGTTSLSRVY